MSEASNAGEKKSPIELVSDEDWKNRVKAEDAKLDAALQDKETPADSDDAVELPEASFITLLQMLSTQSIVALGLIPGPDGKPHVELPVARHFIDLLAVVESKTKGNLSTPEAEFLEGTLHELRMAYIAVSKQSG